MSLRAALVAIVLLAAVLRFIGLSPHPDGFQPDEVVNGYDAFALALTGRDHHGNPLPLLFESYGDWVSPLLTYVTVPFVALGGLSAFTDRLPGVLANIAAVWAVYLLATELAASPIAGLAAALVLATAPWDIALAQFAAAPTLLPVLTAAALLFALRSIRTQSLQDATLLAVSCALLVYDYPTQKLFAPLFLLVALAALRAWPERRQAAIVFSVLVLPLLAVSLAHPEYNARFAYVGLTPRDPAFLTDVLQRYAEYLNPLFFLHGDLHLAPLLPVFLVIGYAALLLAAGGPHRRGAIVVLLFMLLAPLPASLTIDHFHLNRTAHMLPVAAAIMGYGFAALLVPLRRRGALGTIAFSAIALGAAVALGVNTAAFAERYYHGRHLETGFAERQDGLGTAVVAAARVAAGAPLVVDSGAFNQAYMYYLFVDGYDPRKLPLQQMRDSEQPGSWAYVSAIDNLRFRPISREELARSAPVAELQLGDAPPFAIRRESGSYYLIRPQAAQ